MVLVMDGFDVVVWRIFDVKSVGDPRQTHFNSPHRTATRPPLIV